MHTGPLRKRRRFKRPCQKQQTQDKIREKHMICSSLSLVLFILATISLPIKPVCFFAWDMHVCLPRQSTAKPSFFLIFFRILFAVVSHDSSFFLDFFPLLFLYTQCFFCLRLRLQNTSIQPSAQQANIKQRIIFDNPFFFFFFSLSLSLHIT